MYSTIIVTALDFWFYERRGQAPFFLSPSSPLIYPLSLSSSFYLHPLQYQQRSAVIRVRGRFCRNGTSVRVRKRAITCIVSFFNFNCINSGPIHEIATKLQRFTINRPLQMSQDNQPISYRTPRKWSKQWRTKSLTWTLHNSQNRLQ